MSLLRSFAVAACLLVSACEVDSAVGGGNAGESSSGGSSENGGSPATGGDSAGGAQANGGAPLVGGEGAGLPEGEPCVANGSDGVCIDVSECTVAGYAPVPGFCPGPAEIQCCVPIDPLSCDESAMPLPNAGLAEAPGTGGCPAGMRLVDTFCVDRYEAFLVSYPDEDPVSPYFNPGALDVMAKSAAGAVPQGYITGVQAEEACLNAGKRLCSDDEWLRACQGPADWTYPYGDDLVLGQCNDHRDEHPVVEYFMTTDDWIWSELGNPCINQLHDSLAETGAFSDCETAEGLSDMMGNLHEWTNDPNGTFRGGFYVDTVVNGPGCLYATTAHDVNHWDYSTGFRCCAD